VGEDMVILAGDSAATGVCKQVTDSCPRAGGKRAGFTNETGIQLQMLPWAGGFKHSFSVIFIPKKTDKETEK